MARLAVLASGNGSNFEALVRALNISAKKPRHECALLIHDRKTAFVAERARHLGVPSIHVRYFDRSREEAEVEIASVLDAARVELLALAGFMRLLTPSFVRAWRGRIVNVHPSVLPAWPGVEAIRRAYEAGSAEYGVTVHYIDEGMDTGPILAQEAFRVEQGTTLAEIEALTHDMEHRIYTRAILELLDQIEEKRRSA